MRFLRSLLLLFAGATAFAQAATRPVVITWTASTSTSVTGYSVFTCTVASGGTSCTPSLTGTPAASVSGTTATLTETTGLAYGVSVVAVAPPCGPTTPPTTACGNSAPATLSYVPVPPQVAGASNIVVVVP